jgi:hypothetical protein
MPPDEQSGEPPADAGAPDEGAGGDAGRTDGFEYDLSSVPEELRPQVEPHLKAIQANVTKSFQDAAAFRRQWEPYDELGLRDIQPDQIKQLLDFAEMTQDQERFAEWWKEVGNELNLMPDEGSLEEFDDEPTDRERELQGRIDELEQKFSGEFEERDNRAAEERAMQTIQQTMDGLVKEHGEFDREVVAALSERYAEDDPENCIKRGFEDYQRIRSEGEKGLFDKKAGQPSPPEGGGGKPDTTPSPITNFEDAKAAARERLRESSAA